MTVMGVAIGWLAAIGSARAEAPAAAPAQPRGLYELSLVEKGGETNNFIEAIKTQYKEQGHDPIVMRMTFDIAPTSLDVRTFFYEREKDGSGTVCDAKLTVPIRFAGAKLIVPSGGKATAQLITVKKSVQQKKNSKKTNASKNASECSASIDAATFGISWRGEQLVLDGPDGGKLIFTPTKPVSLELDDLEKQL